MKIYTLADEEVKQVTIVEQSSNENVKCISYYGFDGIEKRTYRAKGELFSNKTKAIKYFKNEI